MAWWSYWTVKAYRSRKYLEAREKSKVKCSALQQSLSPSGRNSRITLSIKSEPRKAPLISDYDPNGILLRDARKAPKNGGNFPKTYPKTVDEVPIPRGKPSNVFALQGSQSAHCHSQVDLAHMAGAQNEMSMMNECGQDNSKAFMGSFGSWFNDLFNVPSKRPQTPPAKQQQQQSATLPKMKAKTLREEKLPLEDPEYFKSINVLKEQFRKKLKNETSVHVSSQMDNKLAQFDYNVVTDRRKKCKSVPAIKVVEDEPETDPLDSVEETFYPTVNASPVASKAVKKPNPSELLQVPADWREKETSLQLYRAKNSLDLNGSHLSKNDKKQRRKDRSDIESLEEYVFQRPADYSKRLLLNVSSEHDRRSQSYKGTSQVGVQETQRKNKSYQSSTRCYTTNAINGETCENMYAKTITPVSKRMSSSTFTGEKRKGLTEFARDNSTYIKVRPQRYGNNQFEFSRGGEPKTSSDDLVKYLMKKVKWPNRPVKSKKKSSSTFNLSPTATVSATTSAPPSAASTTETSQATGSKNKFMQSATSSLVMNVLSKKENDVLMSVKTGAKAGPDKATELGVNKMTFPPKFLKHGNDVKRASAHNRLNKSSYLSDEMNDGADEYGDVYDKNSKNTRKYYESALRTGMKDEKLNKREEIKNMLSNIDSTATAYKLSKQKQKEQKKKPVPKLVDTIEEVDVSDSQTARFYPQSELLRATFKSAMEEKQAVEVDEEEDEEKGSSGVKMAAAEPVQQQQHQVEDKPSDDESVELQPSSTSSKELTVVGNCQIMPHEYVKSETVTERPSVDEDVTDTSDTKSADSLTEDDERVDEKTQKRKTLGKGEGSSQMSSSSGDSSSPKRDDADAEEEEEQDPVKAYEAVWMNPRYVTNSLNELARQKMKAQQSGQYKPFNYILAQNESNKCNEKAKKDKKKEKLKKSDASDKSPSSPNCHFENTKKPEPNCEKE